MNKSTMNIIQYKNAPMPSDEDITLINRVVSRNDCGIADIYQKATSLNIYIVDADTMDIMSDAVRKSHALGDSEFGYEPHRQDEHNSPEPTTEEPRLFFPGEISEKLEGFLCEYASNIYGQWKEELKKFLQPVDLWGLYFSTGPINQQMHKSNDPEIWICYEKIKKFYDSLQSQNAHNQILYRTIGVILHELGHAIMDSGGSLTIPYSLYSSVEEPLADKIMLTHLSKCPKSYTPIYKHNCECVRNPHNMRNYRVGIFLHEIESDRQELFSWEQWKNAKWFLYSKHFYLEQWHNFDFSADSTRTDCINIFRKITWKPLGYAKRANVANQQPIARTVAIRSLLNESSLDSHSQFISAHYEQKQLAQNDAQILYIAPDTETALDLYLKITKKIASHNYKACILFNGQTTRNGLSLNADFFNKKFDPNYTPDSQLHPKFKLIIATLDVINDEPTVNSNIKAVYINSPEVNLDDARHFLQLGDTHCDTSIFSFVEDFRNFAKENHNYVVATPEYDLIDELTENIDILRRSNILINNQFSTLATYLRNEIKGATKAIIAIYKVFALTTINTNPKLDNYFKHWFSWCDKMIDSMTDTSVENHIQSLY